MRPNSVGKLNSVSNLYLHINHPQAMLIIAKLHIINSEIQRPRRVNKNWLDRKNAKTSWFWDVNFKNAITQSKE